MLDRYNYISKKNCSDYNGKYYVPELKYEWLDQHEVAQQRKLDQYKRVNVTMDADQDPNVPNSDRELLNPTDCGRTQKALDTEELKYP